MVIKKTIVIIFLFFSQLGLSHAVTKVYVSSSNGNDRNSGLTEYEPVASISNALGKGDELYLKAGDVFYENINLNKVVLSRYGEGPNPILTGYKRILKRNWVKVGDKIWRLNLAENNFEGYKTGSSIKNNIGCIHDYKNDMVHGRRVQYYNKLKEDWDFWQTEECGSNVSASQFDMLYLYLDKNPNLYDLEFSVGCIAVVMHNSTIDGVNIKGFGFGISANNKCIIRNCHIDAIGGMIQLGASPFVCYGNGVEFYVAYNISDCIVENCYITRCYDCACTIQGSRHEGATPRNIKFRNNLIVGCCQGWEDFLNNGEKTNYIDCCFENNVLVYSPTGFGYPSTVVRYSHILGNNYTGNRGLIIKNNTFIGGNLYRSSSYEGLYRSNRWINNKYYMTGSFYLLCNYLGTKDYLKVNGSSNNWGEMVSAYRRLTGDYTTKIYYKSLKKIRSKSNKEIRKFLRNHKY